MASESSILSKYPTYEAVIGIEVHAQLTTNCKIFCTCKNTITDIPNSNICQVCTGQPGVLPMLNEEVINAALKAGAATHCAIMPVSEFARKHYFYPDLPKNYQITQHDKPICQNGYVPIRLEDGSTKNIKLIRIHMEEDAGKTIHGPQESFVDLNRAGTPLIEIVTYPDISSSYEAREYLKALRLIVQYLDICSGNMEDGAFRADTNISVRKKGDSKLGTKCELKNINSFKFISDAIEYEIERQITLLESGKPVLQETRLWDTKEHKTILMRSKEEAADYRYLIDPDLPLIILNQEAIDSIKELLPELPYDKFDRLCSEGLTPSEAEILVNDLELANYYEKAAQLTKSKHLINWIVRDLMGLLKDQKILLHQSNITPDKLAQLVDMVDKGTINNRAAQEVLQLIAQTGKSPVVLVKEKGLEQIENIQELEQIIKHIIQENPDQVALYKSGKDKLFGFFVGQAMVKTKGKGNPQLINELLKKYL
jgi:aspartyl-tRNA(Asn)/glutamyl-tRNA(Gln) amidotransferase subunit B